MVQVSSIFGELGADGTQVFQPCVDRLAEGAELLLQVTSNRLYSLLDDDRGVDIRRTGGHRLHGRRQVGNRRIQLDLTVDDDGQINFFRPVLRHRLQIRGNGHVAVECMLQVDHVEDANDVLHFRLMRRAN